MTTTRKTYNMFDLMDNIFNDAFRAVDAFNRMEPGRFNKMISSSSFPPTNIMVDQVTKVMTIEAALAGVKEEWINLSFDGDNLKLVVKVPQEVKKGDTVCHPYYIQQGLKTFSNLETSWAVDPRYFDRENVKVEFNNGLLQITIPPREEVAPKKIPIFGKLDLNKQITE